MRGTPFLQAILVVVVFLLAGVPVYRLTRPTGAADVATGTDKPDTTTADQTLTKHVPLEMEVVFAPAPVDFQINNLDQTVLAGRGPQARFAGRWTTAVPPEGVDLVVRAHWPTGGSANAGTSSGANPGAMRVTVRFPGGRQAEKSFWADANGELDDVFTVPGETPAATP